MALFKPGESGNPSGRPKESPEIKELARALGPEAIAKLAEFMRGEDSKLAKAAADSLLDRGFGRPAQTVDTTIANADGSNVSLAILPVGASRD